MKNIIAVFLTAIAITNSVVADDHVVIVLDTSGSMADQMSVGKSRMEVAQDALVNVLSKVPDTTKVGILTFNGWVYDLQPVDRTKLEKAIRATRPSGGTPLYQYIGSGATRLLKERQDQNNVGSYKLLVVTDGAASDNWLNEDGEFNDNTLKPGVLRDILNRGVIVDAIGLDLADKHALSTQINGVYMRGDDPTSLTKALAKSVAEVGFGGTQDASDAAFKEISDLPESFVMASLKGLTTFSNHPIGEMAPVEEVQADGTVIMKPNPVQVASNGSGFGIIIGIVGGVVAAVMLIFVISIMKNN
jgi:uncharacterized protein YegL